MTDADATRLAGKNIDATRLAGETYRTRLAPGATPDDKTRIAQEGYQSKLARDAANDQPDASEFYKVGDKIGDRYEVSAIHHGAMGVVYGCFDHETKLPRALKTVRFRHLHDNQVLSLFENEAAVWIALEKHPYIVRAYLVKRFNNLPYVITEYVRGPEGMEGDLRGWLGHPRLTLPVAVAMALQIAQGMQHAVRKVPNLVHRDLKPANILVSGDGKAMVTDFGLVNTAESGAGTPAYMSPEQWREDALDARSDIYAYGCILFEMFTSHRLFPAMTEQDWESAHLESVPTALTNLVPELPGEIDRFIRRCLGKDVGTRPQNWDEVVTFFAEWYHRLTGKAVILDFSSLELDAAELITASYSFSNLKRYEEMLTVCDRALAIDKKSVQAWTNKGFALSNLNRYDEANQAYTLALEIDPDSANTWYFKATALRFLKQNDDAIHALDRALEIDPIDATAWRRKGDFLREFKRYEEANQAYDQSLLINPNDVWAWRYKCTVLNYLKRYDEAIQTYNRLLEIDQNDAVTWRSKGNLLHDLKRYNEAIQDFDRALSIDQSDARTWVCKGNTLRFLKRNEEAVKSYDRAIAIDPGDTDVLCRKGNVLDNLKRYEEAVQSYERAIAINPTDTEIWKCKGNSLYDLERYDEALRAYDEAIAINSDDDDSWYIKGYILNELERYEDAIEAFDQALDIYPDHVSAQNDRQSAIDALNAAK